MSTSDELIKKFINGITEADISNKEYAQPCKEHIEISASVDTTNEEILEEDPMVAIDCIFFKKRLRDNGLL